MFRFGTNSKGMRIDGNAARSIPDIMVVADRNTVEAIRKSCEKAKKVFGKEPQIIFALLTKGAWWLRGCASCTQLCMCTASPEYKYVKREGDGRMSIPSQCMDVEKAGIFNPRGYARPVVDGQTCQSIVHGCRKEQAYHKKLLDKINAKLSGINRTIDWKAIPDTDKLAPIVASAKGIARDSMIVGE